MTPPASLIAPNKGGNFSHHGRTQVEATDADQHAHNLTNWQQQYDQVSAGKFYGQLIELQFDDLQVFQEHTSQALRQSCNTWDQSLWLGIPVDKNKASKINGLNIERNNIMCRPGDCEFELITPADFDIYGLVVKQEKIQSLAEKQGLQINWSRLYQQGRLVLPEKTITALRFILKTLLTGNPIHQQPDKRQYDILMMALLESLQDSSAEKKQTISFLRRQQIVAQAKEYLHAHKDNSITIHDLCSLCNVSRRTLQYSFETILGLSPMRYMRMCRLNGVRRELINTQSELIADIAASWGFWHLSQFSHDYKQLFDELPSETLAKAS